jgi:hypothetical protein
MRPTTGKIQLPIKSVMRQFIGWFRTACSFILLTHLATGQQIIKCDQNYFSDSLLQQLSGRWLAEGDVGGSKVVYNFSAIWILNHQFLELTFADTARKPEYTAKVSIGFDCATKKYVAHWLDNFGGHFSETLGHGVRTGNNIEFRFNYPEGLFMNTFIYDVKRDVWQFQTVSKNAKGGWDIFGDIFLKRLPF